MSNRFSTCTQRSGSQQNTSKHWRCAPTCGEEVQAPFLPATICCPAAMSCSLRRPLFSRCSSLTSSASRASCCATGPPARCSAELSARAPHQRWQAQSALLCFAFAALDGRELQYRKSLYGDLVPMTKRDSAGMYNDRCETSRPLQCRQPAPVATVPAIDAGLTEPGLAVPAPGAASAPEARPDATGPDRASRCTRYRWSRSTSSTLPAGTAYLLLSAWHPLADLLVSQERRGHMMKLVASRRLAITQARIGD